MSSSSTCRCARRPNGSSSRSTLPLLTTEPAGRMHSAVSPTPSTMRSMTQPARSQSRLRSQFSTPIRSPSYEHSTRPSDDEACRRFIGRRCMRASPRAAVCDTTSSSSHPFDDDDDGGFTPPHISPPLPLALILRDDFDLCKLMRSVMSANFRL